jgi:Protein of unknown function (DUF1571)
VSAPVAIRLVGLRTRMKKHRITSSSTLVVLAALTGAQCQQGSSTLIADTPDPSVMAEASVVPMSESFAASLARRDPLGFLRHCLERYDESGVKDYTCTFTKRERVKSRLTKSQVISVRFRERPYSIDMTWISNALGANRALYVQSQWKDSKGRELGWFKPSGAIIKLIVPKTQQPIHGRHAKAASRRTIDQFGFRQTLGLLLKFTERAFAEDVLDIAFVGEAAIEGRPTFVFERRLPYTGEKGTYPDALLRYHIDQEWLVPTACYSFADDAGKKLLGSYVTTDVQFNVGFTDDDFDPARIGF